MISLASDNVCSSVNSDWSYIHASFFSLPRNRRSRQAAVICFIVNTSYEYIFSQDLYQKSPQVQVTMALQSIVTNRAAVEAEVRTYQAMFDEAQARLKIMEDVYTEFSEAVRDRGLYPENLNANTIGTLLSLSCSLLRLLLMCHIRGQVSEIVT